MFRSIATIVCLLAAASVFAQVHSSSYTNDYQREAREIFDDIIGMRTAAGHGNVPAMAEYLADHFRNGGFDKDDIHIVPHTVETGEKVASLVVRYRGAVAGAHGCRRCDSVGLGARSICADSRGWFLLRSWNVG